MQKREREIEKGTEKGNGNIKERERERGHTLQPLPSGAHVKHTNALGRTHQTHHASISLSSQVALLVLIQSIISSLLGQEVISSHRGYDRPWYRYPRDEVIATRDAG